MQRSIDRKISILVPLTILACAILTGCGSSSGSTASSGSGSSSSSGSSGSGSGGGGSPVVVTVSPSAFSMGVGSNYQFAATVTGATNTTVSWQVNGASGGNSSVGTIDSSGFYIAPGTVPGSAISISALAQADGKTAGTAAVTLTLTDGLGTASGQQITCPANSGITIGGTCYAVSLSCAGISDLNGYLWVNTPAIASIGTVVLTSGGVSDGLYSPTYVYGSTVIADLLQAGYTTVQTSFGGIFTTGQPNGWQTGPGGIRRAACRYATLAQWVHDNINPPGGAFCATGNSAGSILISYALSHYGENSLFTMVEPTSGSPISRLDYSCECNQPDLPDPCDASTRLTQCAGLTNAEKYIDPAYASPICSQAVQAQSSSHSAQFLSDSILSPEGSLSYPNTSVHFLWGGQDLSSAPVMGQEWQQSIKTTNSYACVADAPHNIADVLDGAQQIVNDIVSYCHQ